MSVAFSNLNLQKLAILALLVFLPVTANPQLPGSGLPISLDADSSEFDRRNNVMLFHGVSIRQGELSIRADHARSSQLDFGNAEWIFTGRVVITGSNARLQADSATLRFVNHDLKNARIEGRPAAFEQQRAEQQEPVNGRADIMEYDLPGQLVRMSGNAWLKEGNNEILGETIAYNIAEQRVLATSDEDSGQRVQITITPEEDQQRKLKELRKDQ